MLRKVLLQPCVSYCRMYARRLCQESTKKKIEILYLGLNNTYLTTGQLWTLSEDIVHVNMINQPDKRYAFVGFRNTELAYENFKKFKEMGINVRYPGNAQKSIAENDRKKLSLVFTDPNVTEEYVTSLSANIVNIDFIRKPNFCAAYLTFPSGLCAKETYTIFQEQGLDVNFVGDDKKGCKDHLSLWLIFRNSIFRESDIWKVSEDIVDVDLKWVSRNVSYAFVSFPSEELVEKNYTLFKDYGFRVRYGREKSRLILELNSSSLLLRFPLAHEKVTQDYVKSLSEDIQDVKILPWVTGSFAVVTFPSEELARSNHTAFTENKTLVSFIKEEPATNVRSHTLWVALPYPDITMEKVKKLSDDIVSISLHRRGSKLCFAFIEFASEELKEKNFITLQAQGLKVVFAKEKVNEEELADVPESFTS